MARIQVLPLPPTTQDEAPFALILDQADAAIAQSLARNEVMQRLKEHTGACAILVFPGIVDVV